MGKKDLNEPTISSTFYVIWQTEYIGSLGQPKYAWHGFWKLFFFASCLQLEEISNPLHKLFDDKTDRNIMNILGLLNLSKAILGILFFPLKILSIIYRAVGRSENPLVPPCYSRELLLCLRMYFARKPVRRKILTF